MDRKGYYHFFRIDFECPNADARVWLNETALGALYPPLDGMWSAGAVGNVRLYLPGGEELPNRPGIRRIGSLDSAWPAASQLYNVA